jgi:hypothetical protein
MKLMEGIVVIAAMTVPFIAIKSHDFLTYTYWTAVTTLYLLYIALSRW